MGDCGSGQTRTFLPSGISFDVAIDGGGAEARARCAFVW
jgi:hypothetical protein